LAKEIAIASVALGANIIEKHITASRREGGPDAGFSLEPDEFKDLVKWVRSTESALGKPFYGAGEKESENIIFRKSLFVVEDVRRGERFTEKNMRSIRPGYGLAPKYYKEVINKIAAADIKRGTPLTKKLIRKL
jgi:sialic acid synthase SpsE